jgi:hypothetical protein
VEVENITGVSLTSGGTTEQKRHLTVGNGLLGQIVVDDQGVAAVVTEPLTNGGTGEGSDVLERGGLRGSGGNNNRVLHRVVFLEGLDELGDGRTLLADSDVDTVKLLLLVGTAVPTLLVEHGIESDGSLSGLTITNDQLTLATTNGNHGIDGLETSLDGLADGLAGENARSLELGTALLLGVERALAVNRVSEGIDDTSEQLRADRDIDL